MWLIDTEWKQMPSDAFRSRFSPHTHVFDTILSKCDPSSPRELWNEYHYVFITDISNLFRRNGELLRGDSDTLENGLLEVRDYLSDMFTAPFSTFGLSTSREYFDPPAT